MLDTQHETPGSAIFCSWTCPESQIITNYIQVADMRSKQNVLLDEHGLKIILKSPAVYTYILPWYSKVCCLWPPVLSPPHGALTVGQTLWVRRWKLRSPCTAPCCAPSAFPPFPLGFLDWLIPLWMTHSSFDLLIQSIKLHSYFMAWKPASLSQVTFFYFKCIEKCRERHNSIYLLSITQI